MVAQAGRHLAADLLDVTGPGHQQPDVGDPTHQLGQRLQQDGQTLTGLVDPPEEHHRGNIRLARQRPCVGVTRDLDAVGHQHGVTAQVLHDHPAGGG